MFEGLFGKKENQDKEKAAEKNETAEEYRQRIVSEASPAKKEIWKLQEKMDKIDETIQRLMFNENNKEAKKAIEELARQKLALRKEIDEKWKEDEEYIDPEKLEVDYLEHLDKRKPKS